MKGQTTLEFVGSFIFFILVMISVLTLTVDEIPRFNDYAEVSEKNLEAKRTTDLLLTSPGRHEGGSRGTDWENYVSDAVEPGLASPDEEFVVEREKLDSIGKTGDSVYNYTDFRKHLGLEYDYNFKFTWMPVVETSDNFIRGSTPSSPGIDEPVTDFYNDSENRVHYGEIRLNGRDIRLLVTAYDGEYNTTYVEADSWDFTGNTPYGEGDVPPALADATVGRDFTIQSINNRDNRPGTAIVLKSGLGEFGRNEKSASGNIEKLNRYPLLEDADSSRELMRVEVLTW